MSDPADWRSRRPQRDNTRDGEWSAPKTGTIWSPTAGHNVAVGSLLVAVVALLGWFAWDAIRKHQQPTPLLALIARDYSGPAPPNPLAAEDTEWLRTVLDRYRNIDLKVPDDSPRSTLELLEGVRKLLAAEDTASPDERAPARIIYISAIGMVNSAGDPCLLLPDHDPLDDATWLTWKELHGAIRQSRPEETKDLLLLDASQVQTDWSLGVIQNGFVTLLEEELNRQPDEGLSVVSASSGLQGRLAAPAQTATPFAYFAAAGLRGAADKDPFGNDDSAVTLDELTGYVAEEVARWSKAHGGLEQRPKRLGPELPGADDLVLAQVAGYRGTNDLGVTRLAKKSIAASQKLWEQYGEIQQDQRPLAAAPVESALLTQHLLLADAYRLAGGAYAGDQDTEEADADSRLSAIRKARFYPDGIRAGSLPTHDLFAPSAVAPEGLAKAWDAWLEKPEENPPPGNYADRVRVVWNRLSNPDSAGRAPDFVDAVRFLDAPGAMAPEIDLPEAVLIRLLRDHADWSHGSPEPKRLAKLLRAFGETHRLWVPQRPEIVHWVAPYLIEVERDLNRALDLTLLGDVDSRYDADERVAKTLGDLRDIAKLSRAASAACDQRDRALALVLPAGEWAQTQALLEPRARPLLDQQVVRLIKSVDSLGALLNDGPGDQTSAAAAEKQVRTASAQVSRTSDALLENFRDRVEQMANVERGSSVEERPERIGLLRRPLTVDSVWCKMRKLHLTGTESGGYDKDADGTDRDSGDDDKDADGADRGSGGDDPKTNTAHLEWLVGFRHPLWEVVEAERPARPADATHAERLRLLARLGGAVRRAVAAFGSDVTEANRDALKRLDEGDLIAAREPLAKAADQLRRSAPLAQGRLVETDAAWNVVERLRDFDAHAWSLWQAQRTRESAWRAEPMSEGPWFAKDAQRRLDEAGRLFDVGAGESAPLRAERSRLRQARERLAKWKPLPPRPVSAMIGLDGIESVALQGGASGIAAVTLTGSGGKRFGDANGLTRRQLRLAEGSEVPYSVEASSLRGVNALKASTLFRGHTWSADYSVLHPVEVAYRRPPTKAATIRVRADRPERADIAFVFDCSASMNEKAGDEAKTIRIVAARNAFKRALEDLRDQGSRDRACLYFYGRRAAQDKSTLLLKFRGAFQKHPGEDVELGIRPMDLKEFSKELPNVIDRVEPYGLTPLYLAIDTALQRLERSTFPDKLRVIVLTDGANQIGPNEWPLMQPLPDGSDSVRLTKPRDIDDIRDRLRELQDRPIEIDIILFGDEQGEPGIEELEDLEREYPERVRLVKVDSSRDGAKQLENRLREALDVDAFRVASQRGGGAKPQTVGLGGQVEIPPGEYTVSLERGEAKLASVVVEGGEAIELRHVRDRRTRAGRFTVERYYFGDNPIEETGGFRIGAESRRDGDGYALRFAIERQEETQPCARPQVVWARVTPEPDEGEREALAETRYFFDRRFVRERGTPVLECPLPTWPTRNLRANAEVCFAMKRPRLGLSIGLDRLGQEPLHRLTESAKLTITRVKTSQGLRVVVEERPRGDVADDYPLHVQIDPPADEVRRSFSDTERAARHVFLYESKSRRNRLSGDGSNRRPTKLHVLTKDQIAGEGVGPVKFQVELRGG